MSIEELKKTFIVDDDAIHSRMERLLQLALKHCVIDRKGVVHLNNPKLSAPTKVKLVLAARFSASKLEESISASVTAQEISESTGVPTDQVSARAKDAIDARFAESTGRGSYKASPHKIEAFLDSVEN